MKRFEKNGLCWLEFDLLSDTGKLKHGVFTRHGGSSRGPYRGLNVSYTTGDNAKDVDENLSKIMSVLEIDALSWATQVHGVDVQLVEDTATNIPDCDALISNRPGAAMMIKHADCQVAIIYDPVQHATALIHSGWKGSVLNIYENSIRALEKHFGSRPEDLLVGISPSLGPNTAEFVNYRKELPKSFYPFQIRPTYFDFWKISEDQLLRCGVLPNHIELAKICTVENPDDFYSYRRDGITGRNGTCVMLL